MSTHSDRINRALTQAEVSDIELALDAIEQNLSFLRTLTPEEKTHKVRLAVNNWGFVRVAKDAYDDMPELLPRFIDPGSYENDLALLDQLQDVSTRTEQILHLIQDTEILLGDLVYKDSLGMFAGAAEAKKRGTGRARLWHERLRVRFYGLGNRGTNDEDDTEDPQTTPPMAEDDDPTVDPTMDSPTGPTAETPSDPTTDPNTGNTGGGETSSDQDS